MELVALCSSGLEGAVCIELRRLGLKITKVTAGHVHFEAQLQDVPTLNLTFNSADRVLMHMSTFEALNFDDLYEGTHAVDWQQVIHPKGTVVVEKIKVRNSKLSATGAIASVVKKAIYNKIRSSGESDGTEYPMYVYLKNNTVSLMIDTTGKDGLNKRGYRIKTSRAPLRETIAAALILLSGWDENITLVDPFCGSGTIPIEAARIALRMPNNRRRFSFEKWPIFRNEISKAVHIDVQKKGIVSIGFDKDCQVLRIAAENAENAAVKENVVFECRSFESLEPFRNRKLHVVTNPPFGFRMKEANSEFYRKLARLTHTFLDSTVCLITPREDLEKFFNKKAKKKFRFQNSGIWTWCYIFE
ncbi:MAG TPA: THUMP domain-containing protein [Pseudothermotoga sp.]|nr:THUMP domain-containing protein [Pseudothermotoga sp.]HOK83095.1 THUMP domain-containing protein [Pseudothermotoga sp.]HPP69734.1 THUMP domain-containing protein [Pseudothermotoga sp.]